MAISVPRCLDVNCPVHSGCAQKLLWDNRILYGAPEQIVRYLYRTVRPHKTAFPYKIQNSRFQICMVDLMGNLFSLIFLITSPKIIARTYDTCRLYRRVVSTSATICAEN
jgi:hypothetical protein